ncbi:T9SS type B sorting domain-containing protein [Gelidibacter gilvus]|uniref:T9SS type B sorting domain-containing protein n=1 Tax=Gelidibacter gilvus TaxID=59602 RepID=A0A4Q0XJK1_9FLAO|nr:choice-of-anchor L domain-containing protein [Gelidibacter gilvus]RXJ50627.1 T9SS type B sorting domain-containing protein [Gelidibacter gilvus]
MRAFQISLLAFACILCNQAFGQQISVNSKATPQQLIENHLIRGCVEISEVGSPVNGSINGFSSYGYFERGNSNFPFENGIILSTGNANSAGNKLIEKTLNDGDEKWLSDPDLEKALGISNTLNATVIEFNFSSLSNQIQFNYLLASEEYYGNYPCDYSDGFAFLIKRAGTNDPYQNIAIIPETDIPVNTNTIHNQIVGFCPASNEEYFDGYGIGDTNYDGRTKVMTATAITVPNVVYHIKLIIADQTDSNYDSAVFIEGNSFAAVVDLGEDITTCADRMTLDGNIDNPEGVYSWFLNDVLLPSETQSTLTAYESGTYTVKIDIPLGDGTCTIDDSVALVLSSTQTASDISDFAICDDLTASGIGVFDLSTKNNEILKAVPKSEYRISYHYTNNDAVDNNNAISEPVTNTINSQPIFVRIEDTVNGCMAYSSFNLVVHPLPNIVTPTDLIACDDVIQNGLSSIYLNEKDDEITNGQPNLKVEYYHTQSDADEGIDPIASPYTNQSRRETIFVRVSDLETKCVITTTLNIIVLDKPFLNTGNHFLDACDPEHDGFSQFNLTDITPDILNGLTGVSITFHEIYDEALTGTNPIPDPVAYTNTTKNFQTIYIRVVDDESGCASVTSFEIHANLLLTGTNIKDFSICDVKDGEIPSFDLNNIAEVIINDLPDVTIIFYETFEDQTNQTNALNPAFPYLPTSFPKTLYITLKSSQCTETSEIQLLLNPFIDFPSIESVTYCDTDQDGITDIDLSSFSGAVANGEDGYIVRYYETQDDADKNINVLPNFYTNTSNPLRLYTRTTSRATGCSDIKSFKITVLPAPETHTPEDIIICDDDQDGFTIIDLSTTINELVAEKNNRSFSFHESFEDAEHNTEAISNITNYRASTQTLYARVENQLTGCHSIEPIKIIVNTLPVFTAISDFIYCENSSDGFGEFIFKTKDSEILNGQNGKVTSYYLNQNDAENRTNAINKTKVYKNISNPQRIFVRVENTTDMSCYGTSSFNIEVGTSPDFNVASDWFVCDDISNDSIEIFDLSEKITEISAGINDNLHITFYTSYANAQNTVNPINTKYANTKNPQKIYARIENGSICASITDFSLGVIKAPDANPSKPIIQCDTDYDGQMTFNLKQSEIDILEVRQNNLVVAYYETQDDLEAEINPIVRPESYKNISNQQTVYVRLTNTISGCYLSIPLDLIVNLPPKFNPIETISICDNAAHEYDLSEVDDLLVGNTPNINITYHKNKKDALDAANALDKNYRHKYAVEKIHVRIENILTQCFTTHQFTMKVDPLPIAHTASDLEHCDDDFDGLYLFDLSQQTATILGDQDPDTFRVSYYETGEAAHAGSNALSTFYAASDVQTIYVRIENNATGCYSTTNFQTYVHRRPIVEIPDQVICLDRGPLLVSANTNMADDVYLWSTNETTPEIEITEIGVYWVKVSTIFGCETTQVFNVIESEAATIEFTETIDFSDPNNITVTIRGIGNYLYVLNDKEPQESNVFENVPIGLNVVKIIDLNGCSDVKKEVVVIDTPKFMTPNDDGYFDTWHITGVETLPGTVIYIYDRYGKQLAYLTSSSKGWDGTYNGHKMPSSDYWFVADVKKDNLNFQFKGHFTLKR